MDGQMDVCMSQLLTDGLKLSSAMNRQRLSIRAVEEEEEEMATAEEEEEEDRDNSI